MLPRGLLVRHGFFHVDIGINGGRYRKSLKIPASKPKEAIKVFERLRLEIAKGNIGIHSKKDPLLCTIFDNYICFKRNIVTENTLDQVQGWFKHMLKATAALNASDLTPEVLMDYLNERAATASNSARKTQFQVIAAFDHAVSLEMLEKNPFKRMARIKHEHQTKEPLTEREFIEFAKGISEYSCRYLVVFLMKTGCRFGEASKLKWKNVHLEAGYAVFVKEDTKTRSRREVPLSDDLVEMLTALKKLNPSPDDLVFRTKNGTQFKKDNVRRAIKSVCEGIGRGDFTTHGLRHTFVNLAFDKDANPFSVQHVIGHKNASTTQIYEKSSRDRNRKVIDLLPRLKVV